MSRWNNPLILHHQNLRWNLPTNHLFWTPGNHLISQPPWVFGFEPIDPTHPWDDPSHGVPVRKPGSSFRNSQGPCSWECFDVHLEPLSWRGINAQGQVKGGFSTWNRRNRRPNNGALQKQRLKMVGLGCFCWNFGVQHFGCCRMSGDKVKHPVFTETSHFCLISTVEVIHLWCFNIVESKGFSLAALLEAL